jgi:hypothetical protein
MIDKKESKTTTISKGSEIRKETQNNHNYISLSWVSW